MSSHPDLQQLLSRTALGDREAFAHLYNATSAHLFAVASRILNRKDLAEDVLQESFVNVWHRAGSYEAQLAQPMTWLIAIVRNKALDVLRSQKREREVEIEQDMDDEDGTLREYADERPDPSGLLAVAADAMAVRECIGSLSAVQRQCVSLAFYHGMSHSEVASHMNSPIGSVKAWVRRGLEHIKKCLDSESATAGRT
jgi:RNA polymerase sigma-70 factor (ECF subfamily)